MTDSIETLLKKAREKAATAERLHQEEGVLLKRMNSLARETDKLCDEASALLDEAHERMKNDR